MPFPFQPKVAKRQNTGANPLAKYTDMYENKH